MYGIAPACFGHAFAHVEHLSYVYSSEGESWPVEEHLAPVNKVLKESWSALVELAVPNFHACVLEKLGGLRALEYELKVRANSRKPRQGMQVEVHHSEEDDIIVKDLEMALTTRASLQ